MRAKNALSQRRGITLVLVLGMLFLFAAVGLTFSLVAKSESQAARNFKRRFVDAGSDSPAGALFDVPSGPIFREVVAQIVYDTTKLNSALRGHSMLRDMYGGVDADPRGNNLSDTNDPNANGVTPTGPYAMGSAAYTANPPGQLPFRNYWRNAFNGLGIPGGRRFDDGDVGYPSTVVFPGAFSGLNTNTPLARNDAVLNMLRRPFFGTALAPQNEFPLNFTEFDPTNRPAFTGLGSYANRQPERYVDAGGGSVHWVGYDEDYDYPDWNNMFLAMERSDGRILMPSFHRPQLLRDLELRGAFAAGVNAPVGTAWTDNQGWRVILRPRRREYAAGAAVPTDPYRQTVGTGFNPAYNNWTDLVDLDGSGAIGDHPSELDVDTDGDGLKDAIWIDFGADTIDDGAGGRVKPLAAIKIVDLAGRIPLNTAGNAVAGVGTRAHGSNLGASPAEINPKHALIYQAEAYWNNNGGEFIRQFIGDPVLGVRGKYGSQNLGPGIPQGPGIDSVDDNLTTLSPLPPLDRIRTPMPFSVHANLATNTAYQDYPAGIFEGIWMGRFHPGYQNAGEFSPLVVAGVTAPNTTLAGAFSYGLRDTIGRGLYLLPQDGPVFTQPAGYSAPLWPTQANRRDIQGYFLDYERQQSTIPGSASVDEPTELYPYEGGPIDDTLFSNAMFEALFRYGDIDSTSQSQDLFRLYADSFESTADTTKQYARNRMRRMFGPTTWDLVHYSAPPAYGPTGNAVAPFPNDPPGQDDTVDHPDVTKGLILPLPSPGIRHAGRFDGAIQRDGVWQVPGPTVGYIPSPGLLGAEYTPSSGTPFIVHPVQRLPAGTGLTAFHPQATVANGFDLDAPPYAPPGGPSRFNLYPQEILEGKRLNLNRPLRRYRERNFAIVAAPDDPAAGDRTNIAAEIDRQILAAHIYMVLRASTHTVDGDPRVPMLAQLAVNIVDAIDPDDVVTRFNFDGQLADNTWSPLPTDVVYGFELPRLVLSEAVSFYHRDLPANANQSTLWHMVEISNPWPSTTTALGDDADEVQVGRVSEVNPTPNPTNPADLLDSRSLARVWRLEIETPGWATNVSEFLNDASAKLNTVANVSVNPPRGRAIRGKNNQLLGLNQDDLSYYLVGPDFITAPVPMGEPFLNGMNVTASTDNDIDYRSNSLAVMSAPSGTGKPAQVRFKLYRLRNPYDNASAPGGFNPYILVDDIQIIWANIYDIDPMGGQYTAVSARASWERAHAWRNNSLNSAVGGGSSTAATDLHTLNHVVGVRSHANTQEAAITSAAQWHLPFLNRPLATPLELLHVRLFGCGVSLNNPLVNLGAPESNFTRNYDPTSGPPVVGTPSWFRDIVKTTGATATDLGDLHRFFEFVETPSRFRGAGATWRPHEDFTSVLPPTFVYPDFRADRVAGKMNINAITAEEVFRALFDDDVVNPPGTPYSDKGKTPFTWTSPTAITPLYNQLLSAWNDPPASGAPPLLPMPVPQLFTRQFTTDTTASYSGAGRTATSLVDSELYKRYLQSIAGMDQTLGTLDDLPFRGFGQRSILDTILRPSVDMEDRTSPAGSRLLYLQDTTAPATADSLTRRRLFDGFDGPASETPFNIDGSPIANDTLYDRNRLLAKIAANVTTKSNVYAVWVTIGWFRVVPGTQSDLVPQLDEEIGASTGATVRHRAFFIIDRSVATGYTGPKPISAFDADPIVRFARVIE